MAVSCNETGIKSFSSGAAVYILARLRYENNFKYLLFGYGKANVFY